MRRYNQKRNTTLYESSKQVYQNKQGHSSSNYLYEWTKLLSGHAEDLVDSICCAKVAHPALACGVGLSIYAPSFIPWACIYGDCTMCGIETKHKMSECEVLMNNITPIEVLEWKQIERQGASNGKQNTQLELSLGKLPVNIIMTKLMD